VSVQNRIDAKIDGQENPNRKDKTFKPGQIVLCRGKITGFKLIPRSIG
jgi:hypothetical protein